MKTLPIDLNKFGFVEREKRGHKTMDYKCGRDFLYYALHYLLPEKFNTTHNNPEEIDNKRLFGSKVSTHLAWTMLQFYRMPILLKKNSLKLLINGVGITSYFHLVYAILFSRLSYGYAIKKIEESVNNASAVGIDIALSFGGLEDHVIFVYGYDENNLYVFDTLKVPRLSYEKITNDNRYIMKISREEIRKRWKSFSRVWEVNKLIIN